MSYNRLTSLPAPFSLLTRLRYLNLRSNLFSTFPLVVCIFCILLLSDLSCPRIADDDVFTGNLGHIAQ
jgi:Leucine-rich repeat (LRR) protein